MAYAAQGSQVMPLLEDTFNIKGKQFTVTLTSDYLKWHTVKDKSKDEIVVPVEEILSVTVSTEKMKKPDESSLKLVYMNRKKNHNLRKVTANMVGNSDTCTKWAQNVQECINGVPCRPKSALVLVNPVSGGRKGPKQYEDIVAPVFKEAAIKTEVIVTESAAHVKEIMHSYDLASIDSLVVVGGDGMYHLVVDALVQRLMKEADLDVNDPENDVPEVTLPIGIIPCGTGNGIANSVYGCYDVETAALAVVRGGKQNLNVHGVWSGGEFQVYSSLLQGFGILADLIYQTAAHRSMGIWRYPTVIGSYLFKSSCRMLDVTIETKAPPIQQETETREADSLNESAKGNSDLPSQCWKSWQGRCVQVTTFLMDIAGYRESRNPAHLGCTRCHWMHQWSRTSFFKFFYYLSNFNPAILHWDKIDHEPVVEYRVTLNNPEEQEGHANLMNIDGEVFHLKQPNYHVKVFPGKLSLFASVTKEYILTL